MNKNILKYANEVTAKINNITQLLTGETGLTDGLLGDIYCCVFDMVKEYLIPVVVKEINDDEFDNMVTRIMYAEKEDEINDIIKKYCIVSE